jgi:hypothetical protein
MIGKRLSFGTIKLAAGLVVFLWSGTAVQAQEPINGPAPGKRDIADPKKALAQAFEGIGDALPGGNPAWPPANDPPAAQEEGPAQEVEEAASPPPATMTVAQEFMRWFVVFAIAAACIGVAALRLYFAPGRSGPLPYRPPAAVFQPTTVTPVGSPPLPTADLSTAISSQPAVKPPSLPLQGVACDNLWEEPSEPPGFFTARLAVGWNKRLCRVYLLSKEMVLLNAGSEAADRIAASGFALGGLIGGLIGNALAQSQRRQDEARLHHLDRANAEDLRFLAKRERDSIWVKMDEVDKAWVEPSSPWRGWLTARCTALLHLQHRVCGRITLELPTGTEVRLAREYLAPHLGTRFKPLAAEHAKR